MTGASQGIGRAIAIRLAQEGATVAINFVGAPSTAETGPKDPQITDRGKPEPVDQDLPYDPGQPQENDEGNSGNDPPCQGPSAEGKPVDAVRGAALVIPAKKQGMEKAVPMVIGGLFSPASYAPGPYSNFIYAKVDLDRKIHSDPAGMTSVEESWSFTTDGGDSVQFRFNMPAACLGGLMSNRLSIREPNPTSIAYIAMSKPRTWCAVQ